jgi:SET domain-containing protein
VFARRAFRPGEVIERAPVLILSPEDYRQLRKTSLVHYPFGWGRNGRGTALALGLASFYNHSGTPNADCFEYSRDHLLEFVALRSVAPGEEITIDYTGGDPGARLWFKTVK